MTNEETYQTFLKNETSKGHLLLCCECGVAAEGNITLAGAGESVCDSCHESLEDSYGCPGCDAEPGDGYTAHCHHPEGCGYFKQVFGALSNRIGKLK